MTGTPERKCPTCLTVLVVVREESGDRRWVCLHCNLAGLPIRKATR